MGRLLVLASEPTAGRRTVFFHLVGTDGISPATGEAGGQPQISTNSGGWTNTGIGTLTAIGNGRYSAILTSAAVANAGAQIETRYKSATTAECPGDSVTVVAIDPYTAYVPADVYRSLGADLTHEDGTLASATASVVTFPATDSAGDAIPDDDAFEYTQVFIVGGTGKGRTVRLTTAGVAARSYNVHADDVPATVDGTSRYELRGTWTAAPDAALLRAALGLAAANLDTQLGDLTTDVTWTRNVLEGDEEIDDTTTPWRKKIKIKGTGTELVNKVLRQVDGTNVSAVTQVIGSASET